MNSVDLGEVSRPLEEQLPQLSWRARSALFGVCGYALLPILREVEVRFSRRWTFPDAEIALSASREFAVGAAPARINQDLRDRVLNSVPNGHDLDSPWSTYTLDASVCVDAALVAASADLQGSFDPSWLYYALESLAVTLSPNIYELAPDLLAEGSRFILAVNFLGDAISELSSSDGVDDEAYGDLLRRAAVINPFSEV